MTRLFKLLPLALAALSQPASAQVWLAGVNIAGMDFACADPNNDGTWNGNNQIPLAAYSGFDGAGQMQHLASTYKMNVFRLPVCWQYLVNGALGGPLNANNFGVYNQLVQACLATGAYCIIDIHNYARWNGLVVGQSGGQVTDAHLASLWQQIASYYANTANVVFGIMNEPHDLNIDIWGPTVQTVVTAIRNVSPQWHMILLPGTDYTSVGSFINSGSIDRLKVVTNPDGSTTNLIFDVHQYLDGNGGKYDYCVEDGTSQLNDLVYWLRNNNRQAFLTETGGGSTSSCYQYLCSELDWMNYRADVLLGWVGWAAGAFPTDYALLESPVFQNGQWVDTGIVSSCVGGKIMH